MRVELQENGAENFLHDNEGTSDAVCLCEDMGSEDLHWQEQNLVTSYRMQ